MFCLTSSGLPSNKHIITVITIRRVAKKLLKKIEWFEFIKIKVKLNLLHRYQMYPNGCIICTIIWHAPLWALRPWDSCIGLQGIYTSAFCKKRRAKRTRVNPLLYDSAWSFENPTGFIRLLASSYVLYHCTFFEYSLI